MLASVGIRTAVQAQPLAVFLPRMARKEASLGLATVYDDAARQIDGVAETCDAGRGSGTSTTCASPIACWMR